MALTLDDVRDCFHIKFLFENNTFQCKTGLTQDELLKMYVNPYIEGKQIIMNGKELITSGLYRIKITTCKVKEWQNAKRGRLFKVAEPSHKLMERFEDVTDRYITKIPVLNTELESVFKFKDLKIYNDNNSLANDERFYRTVFDESEVNYLYFELTLYNKYFDLKNWSAKGKIICRRIEDEVEMCNLDIELDGDKTKNIIVCREGWGMEGKGIYWKKGKYHVEALVGERVLGAKSFYLDDVGTITTDNNPYFTLEHVKLFNASYSPPPESKRRYLKEFNWNNTQYIWVEYKITNKVDTEWNFEVYINFYEKAGLQKSQLYKYYTVPAGKKDFTYTFDSGWGHDQYGTWKPGQYFVEIICMGTLLSSIPFFVGDSEIEGVTFDELKNNPSHVEKVVQEAEMKLLALKIQNEELLELAKKERDFILKEAIEAKENIIQEAKSIAHEEANKVIESAREIIEKEKSDILINTISKELEFTPELVEPGLSLLNHVSGIITRKYPQGDIKIRIEQNKTQIRFLVSSSDGEILEMIDEDLITFSKVIRKEVGIEALTSDPLEVIRLKQKFEIISLELRMTKELLNLRIESLENDKVALYDIIKNGFTNNEIMKILFLGANPSDQTRLRIDRELKQIDDGLKKANKRDSFTLVQKWAVTPHDIQQALLDEDPDIIHFSGHGDTSGIVVEDMTGNTKIISNEALSALLALFVPKIKCVVLNSCFSKEQANGIVNHVPFVVGMKDSILDATAIDFSIGFYAALGAGRDVDFAFKTGLVSIKLNGDEGADIPELLKGHNNT